MCAHVWAHTPERLSNHAIWVFCIVAHGVYYLKPLMSASYHFNRWEQNYTRNIPYLKMEIIYASGWWSCVKIGIHHKENQLCDQLNWMNKILEGDGFQSSHIFDNQHLYVLRLLKGVMGMDPVSTPHPVVAGPVQRRGTSARGLCRHHPCQNLRWAKQSIGNAKHAALNQNTWCFIYGALGNARHAEPNQYYTNPPRLWS